MLESPFSKVTGLETCNFLKKRLQLRYFPVNMANFFIADSFNRAPVVAASENTLGYRINDSTVINHWAQNVIKCT